MAGQENSNKNRSHFFNFSVSFWQRCRLSDIIKHGLNVRKMNRKGKLRAPLQLGMRCLSFLRERCTQIAMTVCCRLLLFTLYRIDYRKNAPTMYFYTWHACNQQAFLEMLNYLHHDFVRLTSRRNIC